jgi:hypothetical protein
MATKSGNKGRYICKVGHFDIYAKDNLKPAKTTKFKWIKGEVKSTEYVVYHSKKIVEKGFKTKDLAVANATEKMEKHMVGR